MKYAFFPGCCLAEEEPEITIKIFDSLRFQKPETSIVLAGCCSDSGIEEIRAQWEAQGKPEFILCCPRCVKTFAEKLPEIKVSSLYDKLTEYGISGGCNSTDYCLHSSAADDVVKALAEDMGVTIHNHEDDSQYPYLVTDIAVRRELKEKGHDAAHILELIFGMGASNTHLIHKHEHEGEPADDAGEDCDGNCAACAACTGCSLRPAPLPDGAQRRANREELVQMLVELYGIEF